MSRTASLAAVVLIAAVVSAAARAEDPKPKGPPPAAKAPPGPAAAKDPVTLVAAPKRGDVLRFRQSDTSRTEVDGAVYKAEDNVREFTLTVVQPAEGGGFEGKLLLDRVYVKTGGRRAVEIDSAKPMPETSDMGARMMILMVQALTAGPLDVRVAADGRLTEVKGLREAVAAKLKGTALESMVPLDDVAGPAMAVEALAPCFAALPAGAHVPGAAWDHEATRPVSAQQLDFAVNSTLTLPAADRALVASKHTWKPGAAATANGAKPEGGGTVSALVSRTDGLALRVESKLFANRTTADMKATSFTNSTLERLTASGKPVAPAEEPKPPAAPAPGAPKK